MRTMELQLNALRFYADQNNWFGAPAPVYSDSGKKAVEALKAACLEDGWWYNDAQGLSLSEINMLKVRLGDSVWDGLIHFGGINDGMWLPWPGEQGKPVRRILELYQTRKQFNEENQ